MCCFKLNVIIIESEVFCLKCIYIFLLVEVKENINVVCFIKKNFSLKIFLYYLLGKIYREDEQRKSAQIKNRRKSWKLIILINKIFIN